MVKKEPKIDETKVENLKEESGKTELLEDGGTQEVKDETPKSPEKEGVTNKDVNETKKKGSKKAKKVKSSKKAKATKDGDIPEKVSVFKRMAHNLSYVELLHDINSYGYKYSFKTFALQALLGIGAVGLIAKISQLDFEWIILLVSIALVFIPFIIRSQFNQMYQMKRFNMVVSYLDNVIPIFKNTPKITSAWRDTLDLLDGEMKDCVQNALNTIMTNTDDTDVYNTAFDIIEKKFPNSRIHAVHQMMYTVEMENNKSYHSSVDNMFYDVQSWVNRSHAFQEEVQSKKKNLIILAILTMFCNCLFIGIYTSNDMFANFTSMTVYQVSTAIFIGSLLALACTFQVKMNGKWIVNDLYKDTSINKSYEYIKKYRGNEEALKTSKGQKIFTLVMFILAGVLFLKVHNKILSGAIVIMAVMLYTQNKRTYNMHFSKVKKFINIEFPVWLRDVALNLQNLTVLNAIEGSKKIVSDVMGYYIDDFLEEAYNDPGSIEPYNNYLNDFEIQGIRTSMKVLFTLQTISKDQMQEQTNSLIARNQEMLAESERMRNEQSLGSIKLLGFLPVALFCGQMIVSMGMMFFYMMNMMASMM